jgi:PAS domain S-box-containing protein
MWGNLTLSVLKDEKKDTITHFAMVEDIHDKKIMNDTLAFISQLNTSSNSRTLFNDIAKKIAQTFEIPYVLISEIDKGEFSCSSRGFWQNGAFGEFNHSLENSPCLDAIKKKALFAIEDNVQKKYPKFKALNDMNVESFIASPLFDSDDKAIGLIVLLDTKKMQHTELIKKIINIYTNRVATELERLKNDQILLDNSNKLKEAEKLAKIGSWEYNFETQELYLSEGLYRIFKWQKGKTKSDISELKKVVHLEDRKRFKEVIENKIIKGKPWEIEIRCNVNGQTIHTINKGKASLAKDQIVKLFGTIQDITDKKVAETNLYVATTKYQDLLENINDAVVILDKDQQILDCNLAAEKILEYSKPELLNLNIRDCIVPENLEEAEKFAKEAKKAGFFRDMQTRILTKNKTFKYVKVDSDSIFENGIFIGTRDIFRDITELKEVEQKREMLYKKVEQANKELKDFAYIVSHDLKAPLRAIGSLAQWLSEDYKNKIDEQGQKNLSLLNNRVHRMHNFIDGILEYSRLGRIKIEKESVNINELVESVIESLDTKNSSIKIKTALPTIKCEKIRIYQVFQNLISNSIEYNDKEKGLITIDYNELPEFYQFAIKDNGPGIDKKYHDKIFQIFQTLQIRDQFESTGIGLTIVKRIVELHGGEIKVESKAGKGAEFVFTLSKD